MERLLIYIKHNFKFSWRVIDWFNGFLFSILYSLKCENTLIKIIGQTNTLNYIFRKITISDLQNLQKLINSQPQGDLKYFKPHGFDIVSLERQFKNPAFMMMGAFDGYKMIGYFFLRFFINKQCFVGRLIDKDYRGKGIGKVMNTIMYETAWEMGFRCLSTISRNNKLVMNAHSKNPYMKVRKELDNDYLLVEFVKKGEKA